MTCAVESVLSCLKYIQSYSNQIIRNLIDKIYSDPINFYRVENDKKNHQL